MPLLPLQVLLDCHLAGARCPACAFVSVSQRPKECLQSRCSAKLLLCDNVVRYRTQQGSPGEQEVQGVPLPRVHADFTFKSGVERLHTLLPDKAAELQRTPFAIMQVGALQKKL